MEHVNASGLSVIHMLKHYPISRALLLTQMNKHQGIDDFRYVTSAATATAVTCMRKETKEGSDDFSDFIPRNALLFMDYNHQLSLRRWLTDLRNMYLSVHDFQLLKAAGVCLFSAFGQLINTIRLNISELHQPQVTGTAYMRKKRLRFVPCSLISPSWLKYCYFLCSNLSFCFQ